MIDAVTFVLQKPNQRVVLKNDSRKNQKSKNSQQQCYIWHSSLQLLDVPRDATVMELKSLLLNHHRKTIEETFSSYRGNIGNSLESTSLNENDVSLLYQNCILSETTKLFESNSPKWNYGKNVDGDNSTEYFIQIICNKPYNPSTTSTVTSSLTSSNTNSNFKSENRNETSTQDSRALDPKESNNCFTETVTVTGPGASDSLQVIKQNRGIKIITESDDDDQLNLQAEEDLLKDDSDDILKEMETYCTNLEEHLIENLGSSSCDIITKEENQSTPQGNNPFNIDMMEIEDDITITAAVNNVNNDPNFNVENHNEAQMAQDLIQPESDPESSALSDHLNIKDINVNVNTTLTKKRSRDVPVIALVPKMQENQSNIQSKDWGRLFHQKKKELSETVNSYTVSVAKASTSSGSSNPLVKLPESKPNYVTDNVILTKSTTVGSVVQSLTAVSSGPSNSSDKSSKLDNIDHGPNGELRPGQLIGPPPPPPPSSSTVTNCGKHTTTNNAKVPKSQTPLLSSSRQSQVQVDSVTTAKFPNDRQNDPQQNSHTDGQKNKSSSSSNGSNRLQKDRNLYHIKDSLTVSKHKDSSSNHKDSSSSSNHLKDNHSSRARDRAGPSGPRRDNLNQMNQRTSRDLNYVTSGRQRRNYSNNRPSEVSDRRGDRNRRNFSDSSRNRTRNNIIRSRSRRRYNSITVNDVKSDRSSTRNLNSTVTDRSNVKTKFGKSSHNTAESKSMSKGKSDQKTHDHKEFNNNLKLNNHVNAGSLTKSSSSSSGSATKSRSESNAKTSTNAANLNVDKAVTGTKTNISNQLNLVTVTDKKDDIDINLKSKQVNNVNNSNNLVTQMGVTNNMSMPMMDPSTTMMMPMMMDPAMMLMWQQQMQLMSMNLMGQASTNMPNNLQLQQQQQQQMNGLTDQTQCQQQAAMFQNMLLMQQQQMAQNSIQPMGQNSNVTNGENANNNANG